MVPYPVSGEFLTESMGFSCRSCGNTNLDSVLSLGRMPLANALLTAQDLDRQEQTYPLDLVFCPRCSLVQITETLPPEVLFKEYIYFSSFSDTMLRHAKSMAEYLVRSRKLDAHSLVMELGSNDGYLLKNFVEAGIPVLGIEPADNVAKVAQARGFRTISEFFGEGLARNLHEQGLTADVIIANNVLAHVADLNGFVEGIQVLLKEEGVALIEVPYVMDLVDHCEFDTIYHEHLCYYSVTALDHLFYGHRLMLLDVQRIPIHGGSLRLLVGHDGAGSPNASVASALSAERQRGMNQVGYYRNFERHVVETREGLRSLLSSLRQDGNRLAAYGAAAKGTVLLNYCGIGGDILDFVVDRSPYKQGRYVPGVRLPIYPTQRLVEEMVQYVLALTWNFVDEILEQQAEYRRRGGRFIVPMPLIKIV